MSASTNFKHASPLVLDLHEMEKGISGKYMVLGALIQKKGFSNNQCL